MDTVVECGQTLICESATKLETQVCAPSSPSELAITQRREITQGTIIQRVGDVVKLPSGNEFVIGLGGHRVVSFPYCVAGSELSGLVSVYKTPGVQISGILAKHGNVSPQVWNTLLKAKMISHKALLIGVLVGPIFMVQTRIELEPGKEFRVRCATAGLDERVKALKARFASSFTSTVKFESGQFMKRLVVRASEISWKVPCTSIPLTNTGKAYASVDVNPSE